MNSVCVGSVLDVGIVRHKLHNGELGREKWQTVRMRRRQEWVDV